MKQTDIANAFNAYLATMPNRPVTVWENQEANPEPPYIIVSHLRSPPSVYTLNGDHEYTGRMQITVVVAAGSRTAVAEDLAERIAEHFDYGTLIPLNDGHIRVTEKPWIVDAIPGSVRYSIPVQVRYRFLALSSGA